MTRRIGIAGPSKWSGIQKFSPNSVRVVEEWISSTLLVQNLKGEVEAVSSLHLGLDTFFAAECIKQNIPLTVILSSKDQDRFWDEEKKRIFHYLVGAAKEIQVAAADEYFQGCVGIQNNLITEWLNFDEPRLLIIKKGQLTKTQRERIKILKKNPECIIYNYKLD